MPAATPYFEIQHLGDQVELRPSTTLIRIKAASPGCLLLFIALLVGFHWWAGELHFKSLSIWSAVLIPIWLLVVYFNRRFRQQATVPLTIATDSTILHGEKLLSSGNKFNSVQLAVKENFDDPDSYNVLLVPAAGEPVTLPLPYFGDLSFHAAELLANEVAVLLRIPFERTLMPPE